LNFVAADNDVIEVADDDSLTPTGDELTIAVYARD
jgi:hypothetical protein